MKRSAGLYIHIPFCSHLCPYCDFNVWPVDRLQAAGRFDKKTFVSALADEIAWLRGSGMDESVPLETLYFGGGTPSLLDPEETRRLIGETGRSPENFSEITLEANPESLSEEALAGFTQAGVTRLSLGIQSFSDEVLEKLGREHDGRAARRALLSVSKAPGLSSWTCDLLYGAAGQSKSSFERDLDELLNLGAPHVSLYALEVHEKTAFGLRERQGETLAASGDDQADLFHLARERLLTAGYLHYELSSFCRKGHEGRHNSLYWRRETVLAAGPGGVGFVQDEAAPSGLRWQVPRSMPAYEGWVRALGKIPSAPPLSRALGSPALAPHELEILETEKALTECLFLGLRLLEEGVDLAALSARFGSAAVDRRLSGVRRHLKAGSLFLRENRLFLDPDRAFVANAVFADVLDGETEAPKLP